MGAKRITQSELARITGINRNLINDYYNEFTDKINLVHFDMFCEILDCSLFDLLEHIPNKPMDE
jgi:DNA-binding Xre family transcriptional regulator